MNIPRILGLSILVLIPPGSSATEAEEPKPVAIVYSLVGEASFAAPEAARRPLRLFDRLPAGTTLEAGPGSRLALAFASGLRYQLGERSRVTLGPEDLTARSGLVRPLRPVPPLPLISPIAAEDNPGPQAGAVRIRTETIRGLYPDRGAAALAGQTVLRFEPVEGAGKYWIEAHDPQGNTVFAGETTTVTLSLPTGVLQPGIRYVWRIRTIERAGPVAQGKADFVTLSKTMAEAREALRRAIEAEEDNSSLALLAEVDRSLGLLAEARDELQAAVQGTPGDTALAGTLARLERRLPYLQSP